ncbi:MAG: M48 family metallopeptidase [Methylophilaceae bacterium]
MFQADFFDGLSAGSKSAWVEVVGDSLQVKVDRAARTYKLTDIEVQAKLGSAKRIVDFPDGARLEAINISELEAAMPSKTAVFWSMLHYLENNLGWVLVSLVSTIFVGWVFLQHGVPRLAEYVAKATPPSMERRLGEQVLKGLDHQFGYFSPSQMKQQRQAKIKSVLNKLCKVNDCPQYRLEFRDGGVIGANAFALPGGVMVVTDELVALAENDTEIIAVLAHELGHVQQRHAFRQSIQSTLSGLVLAAATGDVSSMASGLPAALMQMRYSRLHELEADGFALSALQKACLPPSAFAKILYRLQNQTLNTDGDESEKATREEMQSESYDPISDMLSTHPNTLERIKPFLRAKQQC